MSQDADSYDEFRQMMDGITNPPLEEDAHDEDDFAALENEHRHLDLTPGAAEREALGRRVGNPIVRPNEN